MKSLLKHAISVISQITEYHDFHPVRLMKEAAAQQTREYIESKMPLSIGFYHDDSILNYAVRAAKLPGCFVEFGVFKGRSIRRIAKLVGASQKVHGFDSFEGLPETWTGTGLTTRAFSVQGKLPKVPVNVIFHKGWFSETLPVWLSSNEEQVSFAHIDCDLYSSTKTIFDLLEDRIKGGTILLFDEYFNYPNWREHEFKAFQEFVERRGVVYEYLAYSWAQVLVKIIKIND